MPVHMRSFIEWPLYIWTNDANWLATISRKLTDVRQLWRSTIILIAEHSGCMSHLQMRGAGGAVVVLHDGLLACLLARIAACQLGSKMFT